MIADSGFIIEYLKSTYGDPPDGEISRTQCGQAHLLRRLFEESLLWPVVYSRWMDEPSWAQVIKPAFFGMLPPVMLAKRKIKQPLWLQGVGRHSREEIYRLARDDLSAIAAGR